jgi:hypothetical protein
MTRAGGETQAASGAAVSGAYSRSVAPAPRRAGLAPTARRAGLAPTARSRLMAFTRKHGNRVDELVGNHRERQQLPGARNVAHTHVTRIGASRGSAWSTRWCASMTAISASFGSAFEIE